MTNCKKECPLLSASLIPLTQGKYAIVDNEDFGQASGFRWCAHLGRGRYWTAVREAKGKRVYMHRYLLGLLQGDEKCADHINHNTLDNRRRNIRTCTRAQNAMNQREHGGTSKYKGVSKCIRTNKWRSRIKTKEKGIWLGRHDTEREAAIAYNMAATKYFGQYALLNVIGN